MRAPGLLAATALLAMGALAGCLQSPPPAALPHGWTLDCGLGAHERELGAGHDWLQDCEARASHTPGHKQEVWLAVNPRDPNNVVIGAKDLNAALSADCVWNGLFVTHDGGVSWKDVYVSGQYADRQPTSPYYGYACNTDPMGVFTPDGTVHWVIEMYNAGGSNGFGPLGADPSSGRGIIQPGWKLVLAHSHDGGDTWPDSEVTTLEYGDGAAILNDYSRIAMSPKTGSVVTVINTYYPATGSNALPLPYAGELCSVLAWRGPGQAVQAIPVQPAFATGTANPGQLNCVGIAAAANGTLTLAAQGTGVPTSAVNGPTGPLGTGPVGFWFATSTDDGKTWSDFHHGFDSTPIPGRFAESSYRTGTNFEMAYDPSGSPSGGKLYAIYAADGRNATEPFVRGGDDADVYVRSSRDGGLTWSDAARVNNNVTGHQFEGNLAVAGDGSVHAFFMDKQYDANGTESGKSAGGQACTSHCLVGITYARSDDGGRTWTNQRVTAALWDGDLGRHQEGFPFIGDYTGAGASGNTVWGAFPDASNGKITVIAAAKVTKNP